MPDNAVSTTTLAHPSHPKTHVSLDADSLIKIAPDPVFVSDLDLPGLQQMEQFQEDYQRLLEERHALELCVHRGEERRRAFIHILQDSHHTLGELTTGVAHELNNPLNNIGLFIGNAIDLIELGLEEANHERILHELHSAMQQVRKATEIISHLRTFGHAASVSREPVGITQVMLTNARDAMANSERKRIAIACTRQANSVVIRFGDTGPGIDEGALFLRQLPLGL